MAENNNMMKLTGTVQEVTVAYIDMEKNEKFYKLMIAVQRLSDIIDVIPVICSEKLLYDVDCVPGSMISVNGYVRTRNFTDTEGRNHLEVFGYVYRIENILEGEQIDTKENNVIKISGFICRPVRKRKTLKTQREITDMVVAVERPYARRDYIPCIAWSRNAILAGNRAVGDKVQIVGRFQSRQYKKKDDDTIYNTYEVSVIDLQVLEQVVPKEESEQEESIETTESAKEEIVQQEQEQVETNITATAEIVQDDGTVKDVLKDEQ